MSGENKKRTKLQIPYFLIEGAGNTCLVVERTDFPGDEDEMREFVCAITDRIKGKGADQLLEITQRHPLAFKIWNCDGSQSRMCGNGARAILRLAENQKWLSKPREGQSVPFSIANKNYTATRLLESGSYRVNLGTPKVLTIRNITIDDQNIPYVPVDVGNPHAVIFFGSRNIEWKEPEYFSLNYWGPKLCESLHANIEFIEIPKFQEDQNRLVRLKAVVWEIGSGPTLACGSGAVAVAAAWNQHRGSARSYSIQMPGGALEVQITGEGTFLSGPSSIIEQGVFPYEWEKLSR